MTLLSAQASASAGAASAPALTFRLGAQEYALLIENVLEVAVMVEVTTLPDARPEVLGVINRHGTPLLLVDLRKVFSQPVTPIDTATLLVVAQDGPSLIGLVVDDIRQVEYLDLTRMQPGTNLLIRGIISQGERLIQLVAIAPLVQTFVPV